MILANLILANPRQADLILADRISANLILARLILAACSVRNIKAWPWLAFETTNDSDELICGDPRISGAVPFLNALPHRVHPWDPTL